jgi:hypothetical protein
LKRSIFSLGLENFGGIRILTAAEPFRGNSLAERTLDGPGHAAFCGDGSGGPVRVFGILKAYRGSERSPEFEEYGGGTGASERFAEKKPGWCCGSGE